MTRILIIDDDIDMLKVCRAMLERAGYDVVESVDGRDGVELCRKQPVDLVITDIIMPNQEGLETIIELRRDFPNIKIVAVSGGGCLEPGNYLFMAKKLGAERTLAKPFTHEELLETVEELVGGDV